MIGPVSSTGRAMMASLQQAIQKGMPPEQAVQYVKSMATQGVAPMADLYVMMNQFQRLKQQQVQPPQTPPTIKDQLSMMSQSQPQMAPPMAQGIGAINAGAMENPRFAGGGIVAFANGGMPPVDYSDPRQLMSAIRTEYGLDVSEEEGINRALAAEDARNRQYGLGKYGEAYKARRQQMADMQSQMARQQQEDRRMDRAEFFFNIAAAAAKPGATLISSLSEAGPGFAKAARASNERLRALQTQAREANLRMLEAEELERAGDIDAARKLRAEGIGKSVEVGSKIAQMRSTEKVAGIYTAPRGAAAVEGRLAERIERDPNLTPQQKLELIRGSGKRTSPNVQVMRDLLNDADNKIRDANKMLNDPLVRFDQNRLAQVQAELRQAEATKAALLADYPELQAVITSQGAPAGAQGVTSGFTVLGSRPAQ